MTVQDTDPQVTHVGDGIDTSFPFTFRVDDVAWLSVDFVTNFNQFLLNSDQETNPGGSAEYSIAPPNLQELTIQRTTPKNQLLDYQRYDPFDSESHEGALDKLTMIVQEVCYTFEGHVADTDIHFSDAPADGMYYSRRNNAWEVNPAATGVDDHFLLLNIGVNTHVQIDAHIADGTIHFGDAAADGNPYWRVNNAWAQADHANLLNIGVNSHAAIDAHIADGTIHFTEASISHLNILDTGGNSHAVIDAHLANANIHFVDAPADGIYYARRNNDWDPVDSGGGFGGLGEWRWNTGTTPPPATGRLRFNNANPAIATEFYIHEENQGGFDASVFFNSLVPNDIVYLQDKSNADHFIIVQISSVTDNVTFFTFGISSIIQQGGPFANNARIAVVISTGAGAGVTDHGALTGLADDDHPQYHDGSLAFTGNLDMGGNNIVNVGLVDGVDISAHVADGSIHFTEASIDHGSIAGLGDDDHTQYLLLAGRAGGQTAFGGTGVGDTLELFGSSDAGLGEIQISSPMRFSHDFTDTNPANLNIITYDAVVPSSGGAVAAFIQVEPTITVDNAVFIPSTVRDIGEYIQAVNPGFAVHTVFLGQPNLVTRTAGVRPNQSFMFASQALYENDGAGALATPVTNIIGLTHNPQLITRVNGDTLSATNLIGMSVGPSYSTVAGTTVNFGTIIGLQVNQPAQGLFQPGAGVETMNALYTVYQPNVTFGGASNVVNVLRSDLAAGTNRRFLNNLGGAVSEFGTGHAHFGDTTALQFGGASFNNQDVSLFWNGPGNYLSIFFTSTGDDLRWTSPSADRFLFDNVGGNTTGEYNFNCARFSLGAQTGAVGNQVGAFVAGTRAVAIGGEWSDFLLTQAGNITVNAAMGLVAGWTINAPSITLGTGSVTTGVGLNVGGNPNQGTNRVGLRIISNPSGGAGVNAALWVTAGLSQFDGRVDINNPIALGGGAGATLGTIGGSGPTAAAQAQWCEIDINGTPHWIPVWT